MTYVGELGLGAARAGRDAGGRCTTRWSAGRGPRRADAGYYAIESLRLEKGYRAFGRELTPDYGPVEAGLVFATALKGGQAVPRPEALEAHRAGSPRAARDAAGVASSSTTPSRCCGAASWCSATARPAGQVTSAAWGATVGAAVGLAYLRNDGPVTADSLAAGGFEVDVAGERYAAGSRCGRRWPEPQEAAAPMPVNSISTTLCPGSVVTSRVTVRVSAAASNQ